MSSFAGLPSSFTTDAIIDADAVDVIVATDLASRGLDFGGTITHVINYDAPHGWETYVHRIGRTGRSRHGDPIGLATTLVTLDTSIASLLQKECSEKGFPIPRELSGDLSKFGSEIVRTPVGDRFKQV
jgi:superfamily II DNA/RNA helicase